MSAKKYLLPFATLLTITGCVDEQKFPTSLSKDLVTLTAGIASESGNASNADEDNAQSLW